MSQIEAVLSVAIRNKPPNVAPLDCTHWRNAPATAREPPSQTAAAESLLSHGPTAFDPPCRRTISLIQMGAKGDVQPFDTG